MERYIVMDDQAMNVFTTDFETIDEAISCMKDAGYTKDIVKDSGFTLCLCDVENGSWTECKNEISTDDLADMF